VALKDVECWRLEREAVQEVLQTRPSIAQDISLVVAGRSVDLESVREGLSEESKRARLVDAHGSLLAKIQRFLNLVV
jgi:CRP-like cAMP-binding protein